jgi:hypothetical protein
MRLYLVRFASNHVSLVPVGQPAAADADDIDIAEQKLSDDAADDIAEDLFADTSSDDEDGAEDGDEDDDEPVEEPDEEAVEQPVHGVSVDECFVDVLLVEENSDEVHDSDDFLFLSFSASQTANEVLSGLVEQVAMLELE